ncbi:hypothetical protein OWR28_11355 [Chryseobacterium sp. 1B4]
MLGIINWPFFVILFALVISMGFLYSIYAILVDLVSHQVYTKRKDFLRLIFTAFSEPFYFHPIVVKAGVNGFIDYFKKSHGWGEMTRQGFNQSTQNLPLKERIYAILQVGLKKWGILALIFLALFLAGIVAESLWYKYVFPKFETPAIIGHLFTENILFALRLTFCIGFIYLIINFIKEGWARILGIVTLLIVAVTQYILFLYFSETRNVLGADVLYYSKEEIKQILQASGMLNFKNFALLGILIAGSLIPLWIAGKTALKTIYPGLIIMVLGLAAFFIPSDIVGSKILSSESEFNQNAAKVNGLISLNPTKIISSVIIRSLLNC